MPERARRVVILGSTGSIGINALKVIGLYPERFRVEGLTAFNNIEVLAGQARRFRPRQVAIRRQAVPELKQRLGSLKIKIHEVESGLSELVAGKDVDIVLIGMTGRAALEPFLSAVKAGKTVAPANKEALVMAGGIIINAARRSGAAVIPVDSEQSAIFQCLQGQERRSLKKVYLTASGGALRTVAAGRFASLSVADILKHPRWKMGRKITVDSATMLNKGFEVIEAQRLFDLSVDQLEVVIHPEAVIHSMVCFQDGAVLAQMGITDMRLPIQYALTYPRRLATGLKEIDFFRLRQLTFFRPDYEKFPALALALEAAKAGGTRPCVLNAADEVAVDAFLNRSIAFPDIYRVLEKVVRKAPVKVNPGLADILAADRWAREEATAVVSAIA